MRKKRILCVLALTLLFCLMISSGRHLQPLYATNTGADSQEETSDAESNDDEADEESDDEDDEISEKIDALGSQLSQADADLAELQGTLGDLNSELYNISIAITNLEDQIAATEQEKIALEQQLADTMQLAEEQYDSMKLRVQFMYENSSSNAWLSLLQADSFADFLNRVEFFQEIYERDKELMDEYSQTLSDIETCKLQIEETQTQLLAQQEELENQKIQLVTSIDTVSGNITEASQISSQLASQLALMEEYERKHSSENSSTGTNSHSGSNNSNNNTNNNSNNNTGNNNSDNNSNSNSNSRDEDAEDEPDNDSDHPSDSEPENPAGNTTPTPDPGYSASGSDEELLAALIYCEGGNQSYEFMVAVGSVVMNRVNSSVYPGTVTDVIYQRGQFSPARSGRLAVVLQNGLATQGCHDAARQVLAGNLTGNWIGFKFDDGSGAGTVIGPVLFF